MNKEQPLWHRMYFREEYVAVCKLVGYAGLTYRDLQEKLEPLFRQLGKARVESAVYHLCTFEGQMTVNVKPLTHVSLRREVRELAWQMLGPPPETWDRYYTNPDGTP